MGIDCKRFYSIMICKRKQRIIFLFSSSVRIGEYDTTSDPDCQSGFCAPQVVNHAISHVIVHPDYVSGQYHHDIALVVLKTPLNYTGKFILYINKQVVCRYINFDISCGPSNLSSSG